MALLERVRTNEPLHPSRCDPHIPRDLETVILKAMAKDPAERYATAEALVEELRCFLADRPIRRTSATMVTSQAVEPGGPCGSGKRARPARRFIQG